MIFEEKTILIIVTIYLHNCASYDKHGLPAYEVEVRAYGF
jgi:hypothetical protein